MPYNLMTIVVFQKVLMTAIDCVFAYSSNCISAYFVSNGLNELFHFFLKINSILSLSNTG